MRFAFARYQKLNANRENGARVFQQANFVKVTDHAILRYLQRVMGVDISSARHAILSENLPARVDRLGDGDYPVGSFTVRVVDHTAVTVMPESLRSYRSIKSKKMV